MAEAEISVTGAAGHSTSKNDMELDMRQMIEKMWDYNAKDPNLFSHIWEQVRKVSALGRPFSGSLWPETRVRCVLHIAVNFFLVLLGNGSFAWYEPLI